MAIDNQFRISELISSGSRAIISKDDTSSTHTFIQGSKEVVNEPYPHLKGERDGETTGRIEKPKYNEEELKKAVDIVVDELIAPPKKPQPDVVPRELYDDLRKELNEALAEINKLETENANLKSEIETLKSQLEALKIQLDVAKLQQAVAENRAQQIQQQYAALLEDFTQAVIKSTKEGIERVSLESQVRGLQAQKETLKQQIDSLNLIIGQLEAQVELVQSQLSGAQAESQAAAAGLTPTDSNETFYGFEQNGQDTAWKANDIGWTTSRDNPKSDGFAGTLTLQNLRDEAISITELRINVDRGNLLGNTNPILGFGNSVSSTRSTNIEQGAKEKIELYFNTNQGGRGDSKPKPRRGSQGGRTYNGNFSVDIVYADGFTETINATWGLRKNRG